MKVIGFCFCGFFAAGVFVAVGCSAGYGTLGEGSGAGTIDIGAQGDADPGNDNGSDSDNDNDASSDNDAGNDNDAGADPDAVGDCQFECLVDCTGDGGTEADGACPDSQQVCCDLGGDGDAEGNTGGDPDEGTVCELSSDLKWSSTGPVITPKTVSGHNFVSVKDPTLVFYEGKYHVFATAYDNAWGSVYLSFADFSEADDAPQSFMGNWATGSTVAPQVFYFSPHKKWYLIFQWGARYSTNYDISDESGWSAPKSLLAGEPSGALDFWVICDDDYCYLFFSADDGKLYRSKTSIDDFPAFSGYEVIMSERNNGDLFEGSNVYKIKGQDKYLLLVECYAPRYFRSWTANSLDGPWTALADSPDKPFAGKANVTEGNVWSNDISHGEMIRAGYDERMEIDSCNMQFLYQGVDPSQANVDYNRIPWNLAIIENTN